jgi:8-oxo-dGTP diphosphatase
MTVGRFLCGIAALVYHPATETYLLLRRAASRDAGGGEWESVTGRVDQGESFETALHREVREELGVEVMLDFIIGTSHFYRGAPAPENELLAVHYACTLTDREAIRVSDEHSEARWLSASEVATFLPPEDAAG